MSTKPTDPENEVLAYKCREYLSEIMRLKLENKRLSGRIDKEEFNRTLEVLTELCNWSINEKALTLMLTERTRIMVLLGLDKIPPIIMEMESPK